MTMLSTRGWTYLLRSKRRNSMVAKRADSIYVPGRSKSWLKVKSAGREQMNKRIESWGHR